MTHNSLTSQYFWPLSFGEFLRRLHLAYLYKPVGVIFVIAFLYHHLTRTVDKINVVSLRTCLSFLKVRGIFPKWPSQPQGLRRTIFGLLEAIFELCSPLPCSREPPPIINYPRASICLVQMTTSSLLVVWIHSSLTILRRQLYETSGLTRDRFTGPSIAIPECNPDHRPPSRQAVVSRKGCSPAKSSASGQGQPPLSKLQKGSQVTGLLQVSFVELFTVLNERTWYFYGFYVQIWPLDWPRNLLHVALVSATFISSRHDQKSLARWPKVSTRSDKSRQERAFPGNGTNSPPTSFRPRSSC